MAYLTNTSVNGDLGVSGLISVGNAGLKFTSDIINIFGTTYSGGTGNYSISIGDGAAATNTYGVAIGYSTKVSGGRGIAIGGSSTDNPTTVSGYGSIAIGPYNTTATQGYAIAMGYKAQATANESIAIGDEANTSGSTSIAIGYGAKATTSYSIAIGRGAVSSTANRLTIGSTDSTTGITSIFVGSAQHYTSSDINDKADIKPILSALEFINEIEPITYVRNPRADYISEEDLQSEEYLKYGITRYNKEEHKNGTKKGTRRLLGVKAQQVLELVRKYYPDIDDNSMNLVNSELYDRIRNNEEIPEYIEDQLTVNYSGFIPLLIKSIQELNSKIETLENKLKKYEE